MISLPIMGVFAADAVGTAPDAEADSFTFKLALGMSVAYLLIASLTIILEPLSDMSSEELMKTSNLWLGPLQGLTRPICNDGMIYEQNPVSRNDYNQNPYRCDSRFWNGAMFPILPPPGSGSRSNSG